MESKKRNSKKNRRRQYEDFIVQQEPDYVNFLPSNVNGVPVNSIASNLFNRNLTATSLILSIFSIGAAVTSIFLVSFLNRGEGVCRICNDLQVIINPNGDGDFTTIKEGLEFAAQHTNFSILVAPGTYIEDNPLTITESNTLSSIRGISSVYVIPLNPSQTLFNMEGGSHLNEISIISEWDAGGIGIYFNGEMQNSDCYAQDVLIENFTYGIVGEGNPNSIYLVNIIFSTRADNSTTVLNGITSQDGGSVIAADTSFAGRPNSFLGDYLTCNGNTSSVSTFSRLTLISGGGRFLNRFIHIVGGCRVTISGVAIAFYIEGIIVDGGDVPILDINGLNLIGDGFNQVDLSIISGNPSVTISSSTIDFSKVVNLQSILIEGSFYSPAEILNGQVILGSLSVGDFVQPTRSALGSGDFSFLTLRVLTSPNDLEMEFTDVTAMANITSVNFDIFESPDEGTSTFIGANVLFPGLRFRNVIPFTKNFTENAIEISFFSNATMDWEPLKFMTTQSGIPHFHRAQSPFENEETQEIRFGSTENWIRNTVNGTNLFWVRLRIINGTLNEVPSANIVRFHTDSTVVNNDGWIEYFGLSRFLNRLSWDYSLLLGIVTPSLTSQNIFLSSTVGTVRISNSYGPSAINRVGFANFLPSDLDTSTDIKFTISFVGNDATPGVVRWRIRFATISPTETVFFSAGAAPTEAEDQIESVLDVEVNDNQTVIKAVLPMEVSNFLLLEPGTTLMVLTLERDGAAPEDTYVGNAIILDIDAAYLSWNNGAFGTLNPFFRPSIPPFFNVN